ncbi:MAG: hypothetical protein ACI8S6_001373 [Myxococcota bacterium]|jgi:hypothetical protein
MPTRRCTDEQPFLPDLLAGLPDLSPAAIAALSEPTIATLRARYRQATAVLCPADC